jgi:hypothetical protein
MNDERLGQEISDFYHETDVMPPDSKESAREVAARLSQVPQAQRRRWRPNWRTRSRHRPTPIPASNGHTPTVIGRTTSMLSPVKAIAAGAIVFALGGAFLIAQPFQQAATTEHAAEGAAVSMDATWVSGTLLHAPACTPPERTIDGDVVHEEGYRCESQIWETDDPRLNGRATPSWNADVYRLGPDVSVSMGVYEVETDGGRWLCSFGPTVAQGSGLPVSTKPETITCQGQDGYAGLAAVLDVDADAGSVEGLVFAGDVPQSPEAIGQ